MQPRRHENTKSPLASVSRPADLAMTTTTEGHTVPYKHPLTDAQFAGLKTVFPQGVCDFSRKGAGQSAPDTWLSYPRPGERASLARSQN